MFRVLNGSRWLEGLLAETAYSGSWFHIRTVLGKKECKCAFTVDWVAESHAVFSGLVFDIT